MAAGLQVAEGEYVAVFDADFVPPPDFLQRVMPHFAQRPEVGNGPARWGHPQRASSLLTRLEAVLLDGHFVLEYGATSLGSVLQLQRHGRHLAPPLCEAAGGWHHDTLTEDLDLRIGRSLQGAPCLLTDDVVPAELPTDMAAFKTQQHRWAKGTIQTARKLLRTIFGADSGAGAARGAGSPVEQLCLPNGAGPCGALPPTILIRGRSGLTGSAARPAGIPF